MSQAVRYNRVWLYLQMRNCQKIDSHYFADQESGRVEPDPRLQRLPSSAEDRDFGPAQEKLEIDKR